MRLLQSDYTYYLFAMFIPINSFALKSKGYELVV